MQFRKDINGLRAIAVIAVVLFHFNPSWMPGGFVGVDIFFVISGFLMTGIIFRRFEQKKFSILNFYIARANRIIPALSVLCIVLIVFGWFYLTPYNFKALGKHVGSSMGFLSNVKYWSEAGYFDAVSHEKWLLHTWSLSVEWQFYMIYPIILVAIRKFASLEVLKTTILAGTILGFIFCVVATYKWPSSAYYLLPARAWEMMIGGVAYFYSFSWLDKRSKFIEWLGFALIVGSFFLVSEENPWPGYIAIFPVIGSFLIIQARRNDSLLTSNVVFQKLGTWSYSIYLWHWPLVVSIHYFLLNEMFIYPGIALSILLGFLSNKYIERINFRNDFDHIVSYLKCKPAYMALAVGLVGSLVFITDIANSSLRYVNNTERGIFINYYQTYAKETSLGKYWELCNTEARWIQTGEYVLSEYCFENNNDLHDIFIWGDSHAGALSDAIRGKYYYYNIHQVTASGCPISIGDTIIERGYSVRSRMLFEGCIYSNKLAVQKIKKIKPKYVILVQQGNHEKVDWKTISEKLISFGVGKVILLGPWPQWRPSLPEAIAIRHLTKKQMFIYDISLDKDVMKSNESLLLKNADSFVFINLIDKLCFSNNSLLYCKAWVDDMLMVYDHGHLTRSGADFITTEIIDKYISRT
ncbi:MAG: acyltransferase [Hyphomicrobiales bacterium]